METIFFDESEMDLISPSKLLYSVYNKNVAV